MQTAGLHSQVQNYSPEDGWFTFIFQRSTRLAGPSWIVALELPAQLKGSSIRKCLLSAISLTAFVTFQRALASLTASMNFLGFLCFLSFLHLISFPCSPGRECSKWNGYRTGDWPCFISANEEEPGNTSLIDFHRHFRKRCGLESAWHFLPLLRPTFGSGIFISLNLSLCLCLPHTCSEYEHRFI